MVRTIVCIALLVSANAFAQFLAVRDDVVDPSAVPQYEAAMARRRTISLPNGHYLAIASVASFDDAPFATRDACACATSSTLSVWKDRPDLSYRPANGENAPGPFVHIDFFSIKQGSEAEAEALTKEHADIDREAGVAHSWEIYVPIAGTDLPLFVQIVHAKSRAAYEAERSEAEARRGDRIRALYARVTKILRKHESFDGREIGPSAYDVKSIPLPGASGLVTLDYLAFDSQSRRLWVPAGNTGRVDVIDGSSIHEINGFATRSFDLNGRRGFLGPSSVSIGTDRVFVGDRGDSTICAIDRATLVRRQCIRVSRSERWSEAPDAVVFVPATNELWITRGAPPLGIDSADHAITVLDAGRLRIKTKIPLAGSAEGYAVDSQRGVFYTNIEELGETIAIDVRSHAIRARWRSGCAEPHGIAADEHRGFVFVACSDRVITIDTSRDGTVVDTLPTGDGLDNIDFDRDRNVVYAAASVASVLTAGKVRDDGHFDTVVHVPVVKGARVVVAGSDGAAFVADPIGGRILMFTKLAQ